MVVLSRPWWSMTQYDDVRGAEVVSLVGYGMRDARTTQRTQHVGARRAGRGICGYPRFGR